MSTDDVKFNSKKMEKMNKLPKGKFYNVRIDIDSANPPIFNETAYNQCLNNQYIVGSFANSPGGVPAACKDLCNYTDCISTASESEFQTFCENVNNIGITSQAQPNDFDKYLNKILDNFL
jgi:predicted transcriptional regulator